MSKLLSRKARWLWLATAAVIAGAALASVFVRTRAAQAQTPLAICTLGSTSASFSPAMTPTAVSTYIDATGSLSGCVSGQLPLGATGTFVADMWGPSISCNSGNSSGTFTFAWSNGKTSEMSTVVSKAVRANGTVVGVATGTVTGGDLFVGGSMLAEILLPATELGACSSTGVSSLTGPVISFAILP